MLFQLKAQKNKLHFLKSGVKNLLFNATTIAKNFIYVGTKLKKNVSVHNKKLSSTKNVNFFVDRFNVKIIKSNDPLVFFAQKLRYENFFKSTIKGNQSKVDVDYFDKFCDHLVVIDTSKSKNFVVGTYRLLIKSKEKSLEKFYTETEFNISKLKKANLKILEVGRSCVHSDYRDGTIIRLLWKGLASYILEQNIKFIIGCASFNTRKIRDINQHLSYLQHYHLAPVRFRSYPLFSKSIVWKNVKKSKINKVKIFKELPPLIKAYIRAGAWIGKGAVIDKSFGSIDVCILLKVENIRKKYLDMKA